MKYDNQKCPNCNKMYITLHRPNINHPGPDLCYKCNKKRIKDEQTKDVRKAE